MVKFGFQSSKYNSLTLEKELEFSDKNKIDFFDVFFDDFTPEDVKNVELPDVFTVHLPIGFATMESEKQQQYIDYINERCPKTVTIHFCEITFDFLERFCKSISGAKICIENTVPDFHNQYSNNYVEFMKQANDLSKEKGFKIYSTIDTGHAKINGQNPCELAKEIKDAGIEIAAIHLHDNDGVHDSHWAAGSVYNGINFSDFLELFKKAENDVYAVIEHWNNNYNALEYLHSL